MAATGEPRPDVGELPDGPDGRAPLRFVVRLGVALLLTVGFAAGIEVCLGAGNARPLIDPTVQHAGVAFFGWCLVLIVLDEHP